MNRIPTQKARLARISRRAQSGQVIILMAFGMMALLAVLGLAIDGGRLYFLERDAQNASDAAVLAATHALCTNGSDPAQAAREAAARNGFGADEVTVRNPDAGVLLNPGADPNDYIEVIINADIPSYFIHLVYGGDLGVSTYALGHCTIEWDRITDGRAVMAMHGCDDNCQALTINDATVHIEGGIATNGDFKFNGGGDHEVWGPVEHGNNCVLQHSANADTNEIFNDYSDMTEAEARDALCLPPGVTIDPPTFYRVEEFAPGSSIATHYASQGQYYSFTGNNVRLELRADTYPNGGIFYIDGNVDVGSIYSDFTSLNDAPAITIVATGSISGNGPTHRIRGFYQHLALFSNDGDPTSCQNNVGIKLSGSNTQWYGMIYAPNGEVSIPGSTANALTGAIIADTVSITGSNGYLRYDYSVIPDLDVAIEIAQ